MSHRSVSGPRSERGHAGVREETVAEVVGMREDEVRNEGESRVNVASQGDVRIEAPLPRSVLSSARTHKDKSV
jgi:hypothetical protein